MDDEIMGTPDTETFSGSPVNIIATDEDGNTGDNHANFKLSNLGEQLILSNSDSSIVDAEFIYPQLDDIAYGRSPNGTGSFTMLAPTFNGNNTPSAIENIFSINSFYAFPNPFKDNLTIIELTGSQIKELIEYSLTLPYGIGQVAGMTIKYDSTKIEMNRVLEIKINGEDLQDQKKYKNT